MSKSTPPPPDYEAAAVAQGESSRDVINQQTAANRPNIYTPFGNQTWTSHAGRDPSTGEMVTNWNQTTTLDPQAQWALDNQMYLQGSRSELGGNLMDRAWQEFSSPMDWNQLEGYAQTPGAVLMDPFQMQGGIDTSGMQQIGPRGSPTTGYGQAPQLQDYQRQDLQRSIEGDFGPQRSVDTSGLSGWGRGPQANSYSPESVQRGLDTSGLGDWANEIGRYGSTNSNNFQYGTGVRNEYSPEAVQRGINDSFAQQRTDPTEIRNRSEQALYDRMSSRLDPQWDQRQQELDVQLRGRGLTPGTEAYDRQMADFSRQRNDAYQTAMNESIMGGGAEASRQFGMEYQGRGQDLGQLFGEADLFNRAGQQAFGQNMAIGQQRFAEGMGEADLYNRASGMQNQYGLQGQQLALQGDMARQAALDNQRQAQFNEALQSGQFANQAAQQAFGQNLAAGQQGFNEALQAGNFANQMRGQQFGEALGLGQFANQAVGQDYAQQLGLGQFANQAAGQAFGQDMELGGRRFGEQMATGQYADQQRAQQQQEALQNYQADMAGRQQQFMEAAQQRGMNNEQAMQEWQAERAQYDNLFNQQMQQSAYQNQLRQAQIAEEMQRRGFSLNEINALIAGQQVGMPSMPSFTNANAAQPVNYMGAAQNQYTADLQNSSMQNAGFNSLMGGLGSLGGFMLGGPAGAAVGGSLFGMR